MPYVLRRGTIYGQPYKCGDFVPGEKGSMADMEASGVVEWVESPARVAARAKGVVTQAENKAKRKAVKP